MTTKAKSATKATVGFVGPQKASARKVTLYAPVKSSTAFTATIFISKMVEKTYQLQRQFQLQLQLQLLLELLLETLLRATHILFFKKNADVCQNRGT